MTNSETHRFSCTECTDDGSVKKSSLKLSAKSKASKTPVENIIDDIVFDQVAKRRKSKKRCNKRKCHAEFCDSIGDGLKRSLNYNMHHCNFDSTGICECMIRRRKWLIADIANYLTKRLHEFFKNESYVLSNIKQNSE